ncbi:hypothetical protein EC991_004206 [Linnemannia zychae]|nr:hypothetical protein EC991_004206 [Linnemannia zychae]
MFIKFLALSSFGFVFLANSSFPELAWPYIWTLSIATLILKCCCSDSPTPSPYYQEDTLYSPQSQKAHNTHFSQPSLPARYYDEYTISSQPRQDTLYVQEKALWSPSSRTPASRTQDLPQDNYYAPPPLEYNSSEIRPYIVPATILSGLTLDEYVKVFSGYRYTYNHSLREADCARTGSRPVLGNFHCTHKSCPSYPDGRTWQSGAICVQVFLAPGDQYKTLIYSQQCSRCNQYAKPSIVPVEYATRIASTLDLWTGRRQRQERNTNFVKTNPHISARCHGCQIGVCNRRQ